MIRGGRRAFLRFVGAGLIMAPSIFNLPAQDDRPRALDRVTAHLRKAPGLEASRILSAGRVELPAIDDFADTATLLSVDGRDVRKVLLLGSTGEAVSFRDIQIMQREREHAGRGKLTAALADDLSALPPGSSLRLSIWTGGASEAIPDRPLRFDSTEEALAYRRYARAERARTLARKRAPLLEEIERLGGAFTVALDGPPVVETSVPASAVASLAARADVHALDIAPLEDPSRKLHSATSFYDADDDESLETYAAAGHYGEGIRTGVFENANYCGVWWESPTVPDGFSQFAGFTQMAPSAAHGCDQPGVPDGAQCNQYCSNDVGHCRGGLCMKDHVTMVASKLGSVRGTEHRNASRMHLFNANDGTGAQRMAWLASNGVTVTNDSESGPNSPEINWTVRNEFMTITRAVGNAWSVPVSCPDNTLCVGSYSIVNTGNIDWWKADPVNTAGRYAISGSNAYIDDSARFDAEKPDVYGNGEATLASPMVFPGPGGWGLAFGTSFAAPMVGGLVAVLQEVFPTAQNWPELVRPLIMVSAISHNVDGVSLSRNGGVDEADGAGVPVASTLQAIVDQGTWRTMTLTSASFDASNRYVPAQVTLAPGETVRAALGWMYCVEGGSVVLSADYDLSLVEQVTGTVVDWSNSYTNSLEMVQYTNASPSSRTYDLRILKFFQNTCDGIEREYAGLAWTVTPDDMGPSRLFPVSKTADTSDSQCDADCSLREAIRAANASPGADRIEVPAGTYNLQIPGTVEDQAATGDLDITDDLEILGAGPGNTVVSGALLDRVFHVLNGAKVLLSGMTITFGAIGFEGGGIAIDVSDVTLQNVDVVLNNGDFGGGISIVDGSLTLLRSRVVANTAATFGGGIWNSAAAITLIESTVADNTGTRGGGIFHYGDTLFIEKSSITGNEVHAPYGQGGGIYNAGDLRMERSTLAGNTALEGGQIYAYWQSNNTVKYSTLASDSPSSPGSVADGLGQFAFQGALVQGSCRNVITALAQHSIEGPGSTCWVSGSMNLDSVADLGLAPLGSYGGATLTRALFAGSPAIDPYFPAILPDPCPLLDQRGFDRPYTGVPQPRCDPGAVEAHAVHIEAVDTATFQWIPVPEAMYYNVYSGLVSEILDNNGDGRADYGGGACLYEANRTDLLLTDTRVPPLGDAFFYYRTAAAPAGETSPGFTSTRLPRIPEVPCL